MTSTRALITTLTIAVLAAGCSEGGSMPTEPFPGLSSATATPGAGPSRLELPTDLISDEVVSTLDVVETFEIVPAAVAGTLNPLLITRVSTASSNNNGVNTVNERSDSTEVDTEGNPCTGETIVFQYRTRTQTHVKTYRDGTVKEEEHIHRTGDGVVTDGPEPLMLGTRYKGQEKEHAREVVGPTHTESYTDEIKHFIREGNLSLYPEGDDFFIHTTFRQKFDERGRTKETETTKVQMRCN